MALSIKSDEAHRLAKELAKLTGRSLTEVVKVALEESLARVRHEAEPELLLAEVAGIQRFVTALSERDERHPDEILGYDGYGLPY